MQTARCPEGPDGNDTNDTKGDAGMIENVRERARRLFHERFSEKPSATVAVPGRVNLIGEHTDYNEGWVLPMALDLQLVVAWGPAKGSGWTLVSELAPEEVVQAPAEGARDVRGFVPRVRAAHREAEILLGASPGLRAAIASDIPPGGGLSSSAALNVALLTAAAEAAGRQPEVEELALAAQAAEHRIGTRCGIMDPLAVTASRSGHAMLLDCRSLERLHVPLPASLGLVVMDTGTRHDLAEGHYNERRRECEEAAARLGVDSLRDVSPELLDARGAELPEALLRRARHVVGENARVHEAVNALRAWDRALFGGLLDRSHASLRDDFQVSTPPLDLLVRCLKRQPECFGARMTGGGFGGNVLAAVEQGAELDVMARAGELFAARGETPGRQWVAVAVDGVRRAKP